MNTNQQNDVFLEEIGEKVTNLSIMNGIQIQNLERENKKMKEVLKLIVDALGINWDSFKELYSIS